MPNGEFPECRARRILVVDDDRAVRELLVRVLKGEGYSAISAANSLQALEIGATMTLDLVLLDLGAPGENGWKTLRDFSRLSPGLPVIATSAKPHLRTFAEAAGAVAFFEKPLPFPELIQRVGGLLAGLPTPQGPS